MNKFLRYSFVALMAMLIGKVSAQEVTLDFTLATGDDGKTSEWGFPAGSSNKTVEEKSFTYGNYTIKVAGSEGNGYYWHNKDHYLLFGKQGATLTLPAFDFDVERIDIEGTSGASEGIKQNIFVGDEAVSTETTGAKDVTNQFVIAEGKQAAGTIFTIKVTSNHNNQIKTIKIWKKGTISGDTPDTPDTNKGLFSLMAFTKGTFTESDNQLAFDFEAEVEPVQGTGVKIPVTGKYLFDFENDLCTACRVSVTLPDETTAAAAYAVVMQEAEKEGYKDVKLEGNILSASLENGFVGVSKTVIKSMMKQLLNIEEEVKKVTIAEFNATAESTDVWYQLTGTVKNLKDGDLYGNFDLEDETGSVYVYGVLSEKGGEKKKFQELVAAKGIKNGDKLTIIGNRGSYKDKIEVLNAYFVSVESGSETPDPQTTEEVKVVTIADFNAAAESTDVWYQLTGTVKNLKDGDQYGNFDLEDETASVYVYGLLAEKGGEKKKFQELVAAKGIKEGSKITIIGNRGSYKEKIEVMNAYFVSIENAVQGQVWDFTKWSDATVANLKADAAASKTSGWSDVEKKADAEAGADPTEASKDNCFWLQLEAAPADGALTANGVVIEELKGLKFDAEYAAKRSLAIAVNYPSTSLGDYAGPAYLWLGGGGSKQSCPCFTIPGVKAGSKITFEMESHKPSDARGIGLYKNSYDAANLIGEQFKPTVKATNSWDITEDCDVVIWNTSGCHIYKIEVTSGAAGIQAVKAAKAGNGYIYNLAGQRVDANYKGVVIKNGQKMIQK